MSRFKLFGLMAAIMASMSRNESGATKEKMSTGMQTRMIGDYGSALYRGGAINQRQRRNKR
jgi:hypothetical protein